MLVHGVLFRTFLKSDFNFAILQASGNLLEEIDRLHSCVIGMANNEALSFRKIPERFLYFLTVSSQDTVFSSV